MDVELDVLRPQPEETVKEEVKEESEEGKLLTFGETSGKASYYYQ